MEASTFANVAAYAPPDVQLIEAVRFLLVRSTVLSSMFCFQDTRSGAELTATVLERMQCIAEANDGRALAKSNRLPEKPLRCVDLSACL